MEISVIDSLNTSRIIRQLALEWVRGDLPTDDVTFVDCLKVLGGLQTATSDITRTEAIFEIVFNQANTLGKPSEWVAVELRFETLAQTVECRTDLALLHLKHGSAVDDAALDQYNERLNRFQDRSSVD